MSTRAAEPALDSFLRFFDRRAHGMFSSRAVGVSRRAGNAGFLLQTLAQLLIALSNMLAQNVAAGSLVLAEVARGSTRRLHLNPGSDSTRRCRSGAIRGSGRLARDQATHPQRDDDLNCDAANWKNSCHPSPTTAPSAGHHM